MTTRHRFLCPRIEPGAAHITITDRAEIHHLKNVLRVKEGNAVTLCDGKSGESTAIVRAITQTAVTLDLADNRQVTIPNRRIILACAIPKKAKFETIIEKCTELGIDEIIPLVTARTEVRVTAERAARKHTRYETVARNAAKQSRRTTIPVIHPVTPFAAALQHARHSDLSIIPCLRETHTNLRDILAQSSNIKTVIYFIGPEGDFTDEEIKQARAAKCIPVTLGKTVLKVDTAAIAVCALLTAHLDE